MTIQQSRRNVKKFVPDIFKWVIIKHKHYEQVRSYFGKGWCNIPQVDQDVVNVLKGIKGLGARDQDITILEDQSKIQLRKFFQKLRNGVISAWDAE